MKYQIRVQNPSGETKKFKLKMGPCPILLGREQEAEIQLSDATLPSQAASLHTNEGRDQDVFPFHLKLTPETLKPARLGDLFVREALIPIDVPFTLGESTLTLEKIRSDIRSLPTQPEKLTHWQTCSASGADLIWMTKKASATPLSIYIAGETGTGKEVLAHLIHAWSQRASGPFIPLHCGALTPTLAESELFGHIKGAYTGALQNRTGALLQAHNGTLFLDEIGDLSHETQVRLLRFLESGEIKAVGSDRVITADVRIICATHLPLKDLVEQGKFRRDLYYRLASITIEIPTLRSRPEDVEMLAKNFSRSLGKTLSPQSLNRLRSYSWPGNVRELRHAIERAAGVSGPFETMLTDSSFEFLFGDLHSNAESLVAAEPPLTLLRLEEMEKWMILKTLKLCHGNRSDAAQLLGVARSTLFEMIKRHRIPGPKSQRAQQKKVREELLALAHNEAREQNVRDFAFYPT